MKTFAGIKLSERLEKYFHSTDDEIGVSFFAWDEGLTLEDVNKDRDTFIEETSKIHEGEIAEGDISSKILEYYILTSIAATLTEETDKRQHVIPRCYIKNFGYKNTSETISISKYAKNKETLISSESNDFRGETKNEDFTYYTEEFLGLVERDYSNALKQYMRADTHSESHYIDQDAMYNTVGYFHVKIIVATYISLLKHRTTGLKEELTKEEFSDVIKYGFLIPEITEFVSRQWGWLTLSDEDFSFTKHPIIIKIIPTCIATVEQMVAPLGRNLALFMNKNVVMSKEITTLPNGLYKTFIATNETEIRNIIAQHNAKYPAIYYSPNATNVIGKPN